VAGHVGEAADQGVSCAPQRQVRPKPLGRTDFVAEVNQGGDELEQAWSGRGVVDGGVERWQELLQPLGKVTESLIWLPLVKYRPRCGLSSRWTVEDGQSVTGESLAALEVWIDLARVRACIAHRTWDSDDTGLVTAALDRLPGQLAPGHTRLASHGLAYLRSSPAGYPVWPSDLMGRRELDWCLLTAPKSLR
jgi:hypothetical protein